MNKTFRLAHGFILLLILSLIFTPRLLAGAAALRLARQLEAAGEDAPAARAYAAAASRLPLSGLWEKAGIHSLQAGDAMEALQFLNRAQRQSSLSPEGWYVMGIARQAGGDLAGAMQAWEGALPHARAEAALASAHRYLGNYSLAMDHWRAVLALEPGNALAHYSLGLLLMTSTPGQALGELMAAALADPALDPTVQGLRTTLNTALLSPDLATHLLGSGKALSVLGEWDLADQAFRNALLLRGDSAEAWAWLSEAEQHLGRDGGAQIIEAARLDSHSALVQGLYGLYLQRHGNAPAALARFQWAAGLEPDDPGWQIALGSASEQNGDLVTAYEYYFHAVELSPRDPSTWQALAAFCVNNDVDANTTGLAAARKLIGLAPENWQAFDLAGQAEFLQEEYSAAAVYLQKATRLDPTQAAPALHLALVYLQWGDASSAYSYLSLARTLDPQGSLGWQAGRLLEQYFP